MRHSQTPRQLGSAPIAWLRWTSLSLRGVKTKPAYNKAVRPFGVGKGDKGSTEPGPRNPINRGQATTSSTPRLKTMTWS